MVFGSTGSMCFCGAESNLISLAAPLLGPRVRIVRRESQMRLSA